MAATQRKHSKDMDSITQLGVLGLLEEKAFMLTKQIQEFGRKKRVKKLIREYSDGKSLTVHHVIEGGVTTVGVYRKIGEQSYTPIIAMTRALDDEEVFMKMWNGIEDKAFILKI